MKNKKLVVLALSAIGLVGLAACSEVVAKPTDYDSKLIEVTNYNKDIYNNSVSVVYDKIRQGNIGSDVLDELLYAYSNTVFGYYNKYVSPAPAEGVTTLEDAIKDITITDGVYSSGTVAKNFIKSHKAYWTLNNDGARINDSNVVVADDADPSQSEYARLYAKWDTIEDRIAESFYKTISESSYIENSIFSERKFLRGLVASLEDVADPDAPGFEGELYEDLLYPKYEARDVFEILHREYYQYGSTFNYVEKKIIPTIYRQLLNEQYLLDETYNTLGRSYARKVNIIKIKDNTNYPKASDYLMNQLIEEINAAPDATTIEESTNKVTLDTFKKYSNLYVGVYKDLTEQQLWLLENTDLNKIFVKQGVDPNFYYSGTEYGDLLEQYNKIKENDALTDKDAETSFTDSHKHTKETGLMLKTRELELKDYTTTGWYIKNGGLTDLPESIRNRLFNIGVANGVPEFSTHLIGHANYYTKDELDRYSYNADEGAWTYAIPTDENGKSIESAYVARINGKNYLKTASSVEGSDPYKDILHYDSSTSTYYIIQIEEACSSSKLSKNSSNSYSVARGTAAMEEIVNEVTKVVGTSESYDTLATKYYLEKMNIEYHDDIVYDYFVENYPDLFE